MSASHPIVSEAAPRVRDEALPTLFAAFGLGLSVAASHGIGRFAYALLLPAMREDLGWTFLQASWMNTANALGYIAGAVSGFPLLARMSTTRLFGIGLMLTVLAVALTGLGGPFPWLFAMRLLCGLGTAWAFSCGASLVTQIYADDARLRGYASGIFFGSAGVGMAFSALLVPALIEAQGAGAWRAGWFVLGIACAVLAAWPLRVARGVSGRRAASRESAPEGFVLGGPRLTSWSYLVYAMAHTAYMLFVFAWLRSSAADWRVSAGMWIVLGLSVCASSFIWQRALSAWRGSTTIALASVVVSVGSALPLLSLTTASVFISALLVGSSLFIVPAAISVVVRQELAPAAWSRAMMLFTVIFSIGQAIGSWATGWLADRHSLLFALSCGSAGLLTAAALAALGRRMDKSR
jgi:MFS family permease